MGIHDNSCSQFVLNKAGLFDSMLGINLVGFRVFVDISKFSVYLML